MIKFGTNAMSGSSVLKAKVRIRVLRKATPLGLVCFSRLELLARGLIPWRYFGLTIKNLIIELKVPLQNLPIPTREKYHFL